jgi:hypothetical protein
MLGGSAFGLEKIVNTHARISGSEWNYPLVLNEIVLCQHINPCDCGVWRKSSSVALKDKIDLCGSRADFQEGVVRAWSIRHCSISGEV